MPSRRQASTPRTLSTVDAAMGVPFLVRWRASRLKQAWSRLLVRLVAFWLVSPGRERCPELGFGVRRLWRGGGGGDEVDCLGQVRVGLYVLFRLVCGEVAQPGSCLAQGVSRLWAGVARAGVEELAEARHQECCCVVADLPEAADSSRRSQSARLAGYRYGPYPLRWTRWSQPVEAIELRLSPGLSARRSSANTSAGVLNPSIARGRSFISLATA